MAKKRKRALYTRDTDNSDDDEEGEWEEDTGADKPVKQEATPPPSIPSTPKVMVTWKGSGGTERASKQWYGMMFEAGKPTSVEHSPFWNAMRKEIDAARGGDWSYEYVVEPPEPEA